MTCCIHMLNLSGVRVSSNKKRNFLRENEGWKRIFFSGEGRGERPLPLRRWKKVCTFAASFQKVAKWHN